MGYLEVVRAIQGHWQCHRSVERIRLIFLRYSELFVESRKFILYRMFIWRSIMGDPIGISARSLASESYSP